MRDMRERMEILDMVDEAGNSTGETVLRDDAHRLGIRHRTSHVWLLRISGGRVQVLLQKRSRDKESYPDCWDTSSAGHIPAGENFLSSALRELREELGVRAEAEELVFCGQRRFVYRGTFRGREYVDRQVSNVYALWRDVDPGGLILQKSELSAVRWMDWDDCLEMVNGGTAAHCIWPEELEMLSAAFVPGEKDIAAEPALVN